MIFSGELWGLDFAASLCFLMVVVFGRPLEQDEICMLDLWALVQGMAKELGFGRMCGALAGV